MAMLLFAAGDADHGGRMVDDFFGIWAGVLAFTNPHFADEQIVLVRFCVRDRQDLAKLLFRKRRAYDCSTRATYDVLA